LVKCKDYKASRADVLEAENRYKQAKLEISLHNTAQDTMRAQKFKELQHAVIHELDVVQKQYEVDFNILTEETKRNANDFEAIYAEFRAAVERTNEQEKRRLAGEAKQYQDLEKRMQEFMKECETAKLQFMKQRNVIAEEMKQKYEAQLAGIESTKVKLLQAMKERCDQSTSGESKLNRQLSQTIYEVTVQGLGMVDHERESYTEPLNDNLALRQHLLQARSVTAEWKEKFKAADNVVAELNAQVNAVQQRLEAQKRIVSISSA